MVLTIVVNAKNNMNYIQKNSYNSGKPLDVKGMYVKIGIVVIVLIIIVSIIFAVIAKSRKDNGVIVEEHTIDDIINSQK